MNENIYLPIRFKEISLKDCKKNKQNKKTFLVTNDYFDWIFLNEKELNALKDKKVKINSSLYKKLSENNFIISSEEKLNLLLKRKSEDYLNIMLGPSLHIVVLTKCCNQKCIYCHAASTTDYCKKNFLSKENAKKFVEIIMSSPNNSITIEFQGGEPLLNFNVLKYIYEYSNKINKKLKTKKNLEFSVVTNLEEMNEDILNYLIDKKIGICTSIDGPKFLHDKNRPSLKSKSSYDKAIYWIKKCKEKGIVVGALATISKESLKFPKEIVDEYIKLGYSNIHLRDLNYLGKAQKSWKNIGYTAEEFLEFWKNAMDYIISINAKGTFFTERTTWILLEKIINKKEPYYLDIMSPCGAAIGQVAYNFDGKIFCCDEARTINQDIFKIGDKKTKNIKKMLLSEKTIDIISSTINDSYFCNYCVYKPYCGVCPVCNYIETGNLISDVKRTSRCKVLMGIFDYIFEKLANDKTAKILISWVDKKIYKEKKIIF